MSRETEIQAWSGWLMVFLLTAVVAASLSALAKIPELWMVWLPILVAAALCYAGLTIVNPNQAGVLTLFGVYKGTVKQSGFWWVNPLTTRSRLSLRIRNTESGKMKVNDRDGNPVDIAAIVVWRIVETFEAVFNVEDYEHFVHVQTESAVRTLATTYPYDAQDGHTSLRLSVAEIADRLRTEIQERLATAGIEVIEARISHLAYASEIAGAMLRRQQATAIIAARQKIVEGAVGMVEMALDEISRKHVVELDEERKAAMVSNLLVVLCSERGVEPVVNAGTLYH
ncbi:MAG TPA: SPFH domain-containing protein [Bryobacteraceae bacterium]|nr:SPFH domain-containing protein [Bryobacteraceae bacterium]